ESVVAVAVEVLRGQATEVTDTGQSGGQQPVQELPHAVATQSDVRTDRHALTQLELRDGPACLRDLRLLAGDGGEIAYRARDELRVSCGGADDHIIHDHGPVRAKNVCMV